MYGSIDDGVRSGDPFPMLLLPALYNVELFSCATVLLLLSPIQRLSSGQRVGNYEGKRETATAYSELLANRFTEIPACTVISDGNA